LHTSIPGAGKTLGTLSFIHRRIGVGLNGSGPTACSIGSPFAKSIGVFMSR
jgi:hypothetical protein